MFGKEVYQAFLDLKNAFDPENLMNPGKIVNGPPVAQDLRLSPETRQTPFPTYLDFSMEGGFELAADLCNGNGQCRKMEGVMCPSFQASGDEYDTTRARAQSLRAVIHGLLPHDELTENALHDVLDLCIECKGCKKECPSQVDMAKMKSELLYQYQLKYGTPLRNRLFGHMHTLNRAASPFAGFYNQLSHSLFGRSLLKWIGISPERELPRLAKKTFSTWFRQQKQLPGEKTVYLFNDTYTEFNQPEIGQAAYQILKALGYHVRLIDRFCCGRALISKGMLRQAKKNAETLIRRLHHHVSQNHAGRNSSIIVLEPSCASALRDDFQGLTGSDATLKPLYDSLKARLATLEEFLQKELQEGKLPLDFKEARHDVFFHSHCHQKSLVGAEPSLMVLKGVRGFGVKEIDSGCCGMAGAFGYEKEHYAFSMKIGELRLLPAVRNTPESALIVASGFSCRSQILHGTGRNALHLAEAISSQLT
jgi:Fe-S oxidoreductase